MKLQREALQAQTQERVAMFDMLAKFIETAKK